VHLPKPTEADRARFLSLVPDDPRVEVKPMFGQLAALVNGNMFFGIFGSTLGVKLGPADLERLLAAGGGPFGPAERPMNGYATLPDGDPGDWIARALAYVAGLPPKRPKR
jgi:TfoX/Sxy family transcriptional regulator of competence genes